MCAACVADCGKCQYGRGLNVSFHLKSGSDGGKTASMAGRDKRRLVDYRTIKQELLRSGFHFNDPDFPPDASSLYIHDQISSSVGHVVWKRPKASSMVSLSFH